MNEMQGSIHDGGGGVILPLFFYNAEIFCINHGDPKGFFDLKSLEMS